MASVFIVERTTKTGGKRFRVMFKAGGREAPNRYAGAFATKREANERATWVRLELAAGRIPDLQLLQPEQAETLATAAERWRASRIDVADGTAATHRVNLSRILPVLGGKPVDRITVADVADLVVALHADGLARESIRKTRATLAMVLDHAGCQPNVARDRSVKLPREDQVEVNPPTAAHTVAVYGLLPKPYRLPLLVADGTGMRVGELEQLRWGDIDEHEGRWRVTAASSKTSRARWVPVPDVLFEAVVALVPREDRDLDGQVFAGFNAAAFRTAITRACKASGVPAYSPHDWRHRRATLWHLGGVPAAEAAGWLGHSATEHLRTYAHAALADRAEVDYQPFFGVTTGGTTV
jgi:integrase